MTADIADRLRRLGIELVETPAHSLLTRGECLVLIARASQGLSGIGATGILTPSGLAYLVWRDGLPFLAARGSETPAAREQVEIIRRFSEDVRSALAPDEPPR